MKRIKNLITTEPLGYLDNLTAVCHARAVLTDSGGLQKEALFLGTPVLTLRDETEWVETLKMGNHLVGLDFEKIKKLLTHDIPVKKIDYRVNNQRPSAVIKAAIIAFLKER
jgi:UDP-N-acetylglucosamine 2-epimerase